MQADVIEAKPRLILGDLNLECLEVGKVRVGSCAEEFGCASGAVGKKIYKNWRRVGLRDEGESWRLINETAIGNRASLN
jgi:hypothetical protein